MFWFKNGQTSIVLRMKLRSSASAVGAGLTGLTSGSASLKVSTIADNEATATAYTGANLETITTLGTFAAPTAGKCRFKEVDATNHPGLYEIQIADARWAVSSAKSVIVSVNGATNLVEQDAIVMLSSADPYDGAAFGLSRIDAAITSRMATFTLPTNFSALVIDSTGRVNAFLIGILTSVFTEGATGRIAAAFKQFFNIATPAATMDHGVLVDTVTTLTNAPSDSAGVTTLLSRVPSGIFTGMTSLAQWLGLLAGKQVGNTTARTELRATGAGSGTFDETTDANEAIRDRGDAAYLTATSVTVSDKTGFSLSAAGVQAVWDALSSALTTVGSIGKRLVDDLTGDIYARLGAPAGASVSADVAAVKAVLPSALVSGRIDASVGAMAANVLTASAINADAITDAKVASDVTIASVTGAVGSVTGAVGSVTGNVGGNVVGSVASVTAGVTVTTNNDKTGYGLSAAAVQAVWDALTSALTTVGSIGKLLVDKIDATISSRLASSSYSAPLDAAGVRTAVGLGSANLDTQLDALPTAAEIRAEMDSNSTQLAHLDADVSSRLATSGYTAPLTAAGTRTAVGLASANLDTQIAAVQADTDDIQTRLPAALTGAGNLKADAQVVSDKTGYALTSAYDPAKTAAQAGDAMTLTAAYNAAKTASQAGDAMALTSGERTSVGTAVWASATRTLTSFGTLVSDIWAAVADSSGVTTLLARLTGTRAGYLDNLSAGAVAQQTTLAIVKTSTDALPSDPADESLIIAATNTLAAAIAALNNVSATDVLAQVNAALTTAVADSVPADGSQPSIAQAAYMNAQFLLERSVSGTTMTIFKPDGTTPLMTVALDDATAPTALTRAS